jgi:hypothetical protein
MQEPPFDELGWKYFVGSLIINTRMYDFIYIQAKNGTPPMYFRQADFAVIPVLFVGINGLLRSFILIVARQNCDQFDTRAFS